MFLPVKEEKKYFQTFEQVNQTEKKTNDVHKNNKVLKSIRF